MSIGYDYIDAEVENREWVDRINEGVRKMRILSEIGISFEKIEEHPLEYPLIKCSFCGTFVKVLDKQTKEEAFFCHAQPHIDSNGFNK